MKEFIRIMSSLVAGSGAYSADTEINNHFPMREMLTFKSLPKLDQMLKKLKEFNSQVPNELQLLDGQIDRMEHLCRPDGEPQIPDVLSLVSMLRWPQDKLFPVLDITRLAVVNPKLGTIIFKHDILNEILTALVQSVKETSPDNSQMLALRCFANLFDTDEGKTLLLQRREVIISAIVSALPKASKNTEVALATVFLNYSVALCASSDFEGQVHCVSAICMLLLESISNDEAKYRILVALGTFFSHSGENVRLARDLQGKDFVQTWKLTAVDCKKVEHCARFILKYW